MFTLQSVSQFSCSVVSDSLRPHESQHARPPCPSTTPGACSNSCPLNRWCHPAISSSVIPFSFCPQSLPASGSFSMSQLFTWGDQSIGASASASVLPMNTQDLAPSGWIGWISLQSKGLSGVFSSTTAQLKPFSSVQSLSRVRLFATPWTAAHQASLLEEVGVLHQLLEFTQTHVYWVGDAIQPSDPLSSPSPPAFNLFQHQGLFKSQLFARGGQSIGASASASVLPKNIQDWFPLQLTCLISLQSKGLSRVLSNTTVQKHQFFSSRLSLWSNSHIHMWLLEKPQLWLDGPLLAK